MCRPLTGRRLSLIAERGEESRGTAIAAITEDIPANLRNALAPPINLASGALNRRKNSSGTAGQIAALCVQFGDRAILDTFLDTIVCVREHKIGWPTTIRPANR